MGYGVTRIPPLRKTVGFPIPPSLKLRRGRQVGNDGVWLDYQLPITNNQLPITFLPMIPEPEFNRMGVKVCLGLKIWFIILSYIMAYECHRYNKRDEPLFILIYSF
jgi:hypothetical protein